MGLIKAGAGSVGGVLADQWKEYFYCEAMPANVLATKGIKRTSGRSSNTKGSDNIISSGSVIAVADGQCMMIVDQGKIVEFSAEPGEFVYDASTEPTIFAGSFGRSLLDTFKTMGRRFTFGGEPPKDQRVYYFNTKELTGSKYGTPNPVPFRVVDQNIGLDVDISIRCFGEFSYHICDPMLFYRNVCGNVSQDYTRENIDSQLKTELMTALQPAFAKISQMGIRYSALPGHTLELAEAMNEVLTPKWRQLRGLEIVSFGVSSVSAAPEDEEMIKQLQRNAVFRNPNMAAAHLVGAQAEAMQAAAANENAGPAMAFMGMNMAASAGGANPQTLFQLGQQESQQTEQTTWQCGCGQQVSGNFCPNCGKKRPEPEQWRCGCGAMASCNFCANCGAKRPVGWTCACGSVNQGKFCPACGRPKPAAAPLYRCDKCGWTPEDPQHPPKFCPECGDPFDSGDAR